MQYPWELKSLGETLLFRRWQSTFQTSSTYAIAVAFLYSSLVVKDTETWAVSQVEISHTAWRKIRSSAVTLSEKRKTGARGETAAGSKVKGRGPQSGVHNPFGKL